MFTANQASQGKALFAQECDTCHESENYTGANFAAKWGAGTLADVYQDISLAMPPANAGGLTPATYASIVAFFASESGYPAGNAEQLPGDAAQLRTIAIGGATTVPLRQFMLDDLGPLLIVHVVAALVAIVSGAIVFLLPKGTRRHRRIAVVDVTATIVTTGVVAFVPASTLKFGDSGYGFFHLFIVVGFVSSLLGVFGLYKWRRTRERRWLRFHQMRFSFSYAGLLMAGLSQVATNPRFGIVTATAAGDLLDDVRPYQRSHPRYRDGDRPPLPRGSAIRCAATRCGPTLRRSRGTLGLVSRGDFVGSHVSFPPLLHGGAMQRHPCLVHRQHVLTARDRSDDSSTGEEMPERQRTAERRRSELVKNTARAERTVYCPPGARRLTADDAVDVQEMNGHGLNRLRRVVAVMLHAVRVAEEQVDRWCIAGRWNGHEAFGNPRLRGQTDSVGASAD